MMLGKRKAVPMLPPSKKKRKTTPAIEEINFDLSAREDYLTGFHKRKLQRTKRAKEEAAKKEREEKIAARKLLREGRKADLEKHVEAVNAMLRNQDGIVSDSSEQDYGEDREPWNGIAEDTAQDHEDEYIDDDRFTTVTVEAVNVSRDGLHKVRQENDDSDASSAGRPSKGTTSESVAKESAEAQKAKRKWTKEAPSGSKKRKKKFRYESKAERKATRFKEKVGNKVKAKARKG